MFRRLVAFAALLALAGVVVPAALAVRVHVRVEGKTTTIFGATEPLITVHGVVATGPPPGPGETPPSALTALDVASARGEFYYHVTQFAFGPFVDQIGRYPGSGLSGWTFKVNGVSPQVGAANARLKEGDRVLWYWATFGPRGGPPTLELRRIRQGCYEVRARDDRGAVRPAVGAVLRFDRGSVRTRRGRACIGRHRGLVRATLRGAVRSNAVR